MTGDTSDPVDRSRCYFCTAPPLYTHVALYNDVPADASDRPEGDRHPSRGLPLCEAHFEIIQRAGAKGRVHAATGIRWWYFLDAPQLRGRGPP